MDSDYRDLVDDTGGSEMRYKKYLKAHQNTRWFRFTSFNTLSQ